MQRQYTVTIKSRPGPYAQYGPADIGIWATNEEEAIEKAYNELARGAFPDRNRSMWQVLAVTEVYD